jgi:hypothetical protein
MATARPHAKGDGVGADGREVLFLAQRFGVDGAAFGGNGDKIIVQFPQALFLAAAGQADAVAHRLFLQRGVVLHQGHHAVHCMHSSFHVFWLTGKL